MDDFKKENGGAYTSEGRKLRPRKKISTSSSHPESGPAYSTSSRDGHRSYGEHRSNGEHRSYGDRKPYGERKSFGEHKPYGEHKSFGEHKSYGEHKNYGEHRPYGENRENGENRSYGERRSFSGSKPYGERRSYGDHKTYGENKPYGERRSSGERRPYGKPSYGSADGRPQRRTFKKSSAPQFTASSDEGINRMISRRPQVDESNYNGETAPVRIQEEIRLNKFIANSGVCSRREADTLIQAGVVTVNGEVVTELGTKVNVFNDDIRFNGERLKGEEKTYIVMNKPKGYVTTASDPHAEKTVLDLLKGCSARVYPVGRLDKATTGVLMFTNDGEMAERLTHPSYDKKKIYQVILNKELSQEDYDQIMAGVALSDGDVAADSLEFIDEEDHRKLGIEIHSGKNRVVRRIFEAVGYEVRALDRVYFAGLTKKGLKKGEWRYLSEAEVNILRMGAYV